MLTARIIVGIDARAHVPFHLKEIPKSFPGKQWDPKSKCWVLPIELVDQLADALRAAGATVYVTGADGSPWRSGKARHGHRSTPATGWADALFAAVGSDLAETAFKALTKALHPDTGGDTRLMQELIAGRERAAFRRRAAS